MKYAAVDLAFLAMTLLDLPGLTAQEKDKKADKTDGDEPAKKEKEKKPDEEEPEHGTIVQPKLLGPPADSAELKTGQYVELYLAKQPKEKGGTKTPPAKDKKKKDDDDPLPETRPDVVMIVIWAEPMGR